MLRRRRSLADGDEGEVNLCQSGLVKQNKEDAERMKMERMAKLKMVGSSKLQGNKMIEICTSKFTAK